MTQISAIIITLNEERNIKRCIASLDGIVDEIVVIDSGSSDKTKAICEEHGARFVHNDWAGYSGQKNFANAQAQFPYIYSIDADEALSEDLRNSILAAKALGLSGIYKHNRITNYCGKWIKHLGWYPDVKVRLFPASTRWEGEIHEQLVFEGNPSESVLAGDLLHYSYNNATEHRERADKYSILTAKKMFDAGKKANPVKPFLSSVARFFSMYFIRLGFLDGGAGFRISAISAQSNAVKYRELNRLHKEGGAQ
jgi:glycosyltransferase involved in cell wall biosynthesis